MILEWRNHPEVRNVMLSDRLITPEEHSQWWMNLELDDRCVLIVQKDQLPLGVILFNRIDHVSRTAWWGFYLDNDSLNQAQKMEAWLEIEQIVIDYASNELKLFELYGDVVEENQAVWSLHQRFGFVECEAPASAVKTTKNVRYMKYQFSDNKPDGRPSLFLFASHNTDFLAETLKKESELYSQFPYKVEHAEFGRYRFDLLDATNRQMNSRDACYLFIERIEDFFPSVDCLPIEDVLIALESRISEYLSFIRQIATRGQRVYVADFSIQKNFPNSIEERLSHSKLNQIVDRLNASVYALADENLIEVLPYSHLLQSVGQSFSNKFWYMARSPFSIECLEAYSQMIIGVILASHALSARALVLDLDNTLWQGVIGDDGKEGIALGGDYPGNIYKELQSLFLALKDRGILLTICSKNTEAIAIDAIENHPEMRLRSKDFTSYRINWSPKSQNIRQLAEELNLGVQSLCFIDDNPAEREEVRLNVPGVFVPELPEDPTQWYQFICRLPELYVAKVSESDKRRAELYQTRLNVQQAQASFSDRKEFIKSLEMEVSIDKLDSSNFERTFQLFTKTNQFNTTTNRYSREQLLEWQSSQRKKVLHVRLKDKYSSEFEGVGALVISVQGSKWIIENFVMSCRVMGRDVEYAIIEKLMLVARSEGAQSVSGLYVRSLRNAPVEKLYLNSGFSKTSNDEWVFDLTLLLSSDQSELMKIIWSA